MYSQAHVRALLHRARLELGSASAFAETFGCDAKHISDYLKGDRAITPKMAEVLGLKWVRIAIPEGLIDEEFEARLAWCRLGHVPPRKSTRPRDPDETVLDQQFYPTRRAPADEPPPSGWADTPIPVDPRLRNPEDVQPALAKALEAVTVEDEDGPPPEDAA